ncbi:late embryogenesis abundant protein 31 [Beta vulgaris subsp. vulgaris]|uniref:late embryogenesis abundant protein 31 n=1 Tax=Beta vulgaris subsp. vulgaris TaxID=3555 RepID=UPI0020369C75|nr:late embryogenesis abundant protein 31 [Beta vulgaris subsp. vulgaris]
MAHDQQRRGEGGAIKYGDVFEMSGEMAEQPISPRDAAAMRSAENRAFGKTIKGGPASIMLEAAKKNVEAGIVGPESDDAHTSHQGLVEGNPWHESQPSHAQMESALSVEGMGDIGATGVTMGEALEAAAEAVGDKPVDHSDAAAIQVAEMIATGTNAALGSGLGAEAQAAATVNEQMMYDEDKTKLSDIIGGATNSLTDDKPVTKWDAERVKAAELRGSAEGVIGSHRGVKQSTTPGGVAEAVETAARINQSAN